MNIPLQYIDGTPPFYQDGWNLEDIYGVIYEYNELLPKQGKEKQGKIRKPTKEEMRAAGLI